MEAIKFNLWGTGATFKRPHINTIYLTYSNIHKVAILGMLGSIIGLKGHSNILKGILEDENKKKKKKDRKIIEERIYPEFYEKLRKLKVSIVPEKDGFTKKSIKRFTETTGFFNYKKDGETFIVDEQFIINPFWTIYIAQGEVEYEVYQMLKNYLINKKAIYNPYFGKNHYSASLDNVEVLEILENKNPKHIHSLFLLEDYKIIKNIFDIEDEKPFREYMPVRLTPNLNYYEEREFAFTNRTINNISSKNNVYSHNNLNLYFF